MSDDCPSFLVVGGYLYVFVISSAMLLYILFYSSLLASRVNLIVGLIILTFILMLVNSSYNIYKSLFPACWL